MLRHTRRRALGLLVAAGVGTRLLPLPRALAADKPECFDSKDFGAWKAQASNTSAGARLNNVELVDFEKCDLIIDVQVSSTFESKIVVYGDPGGTRLPKKFLIKEGNRLIVKTADGKEAIDEQLCGNCTDIFDDKVSIVLPLSVSPLLREEDSVEMAVRLEGKDLDCRFKLDCVTLRKGLDWAVARRDELADKLLHDECTEPEEQCFITTACCETLGLDDDCFELRTLRRYRDEVLAKQPGGVALIRTYYVLAPRILAQLSNETRRLRLAFVYFRYVLPAAIAARLGLNTLAYRLYVQMLRDLSGDMTTDAKSLPRPLP